MKLHLASNLRLPEDTVTSTLIVYGGKGMGKTNFGTVLCEELSAAGQRFSVIDPMGVFWGLRHAADGKGSGIEVLILGGRHGDMPIEPAGGAVVADLVADESISVIIDISRKSDGKMWSRGERIKFVGDYCTRLYERQGERRRPLLQIIDEAGRYVPQEIRKDQPDIARCMGAVESLVEEARNVGVGVVMITQRSARMNKSVSELADAMFAFRTVGPRSVDSILDWFGEHVPKERWKELIEQLRKLPRGTALAVSPGWLDFEGVVAIRQRRTFDSSATPKAGKEQSASGPGAMPDLERYRERMSATIERAKADDPKELRKRIAELERAARTPVDDDLETLAAAEKLGYDLGWTDGEAAGRSGLVGHYEDARVSIAALSLTMDRLKSENPRSIQSPGITYLAPPQSPQIPQIPQSAARPAPVHNGAPAEGIGNSGLRRMLIALAQRPNLTAGQLGVRAGISSSSGTFGTYLAKARTSGWIAGERTRLSITDAGLKALGSYEPLPEGLGLLSHWLREIGNSGAARMLSALADAYPRTLSAEELGERSGISAGSGTFGTYLARLRTLELVAGQRAALTASPEFFT